MSENFELEIVYYQEMDLWRIQSQKWFQKTTKNG